MDFFLEGDHPVKLLLSYQEIVTSLSDLINEIKEKTPGELSDIFLTVLPYIRSTIAHIHGAALLGVARGHLTYYYKENLPSTFQALEDPDYPGAGEIQAFFMSDEARRVFQSNYRDNLPLADRGDLFSMAVAWSWMGDLINGERLFIILTRTRENEPFLSHELSGLQIISQLAGWYTTQEYSARELNAQYLDKIMELIRISPGIYTRNFNDVLSPGTGEEERKKLISGLFSFYKETGFLYKKKEKRIAPFLERITLTWARLLVSSEPLFELINYKNEEAGRRATMVYWRSSNYGWTAEHLAANNYPFGVTIMMLQAQAESVLKKSCIRSFRNWFRPGNKYAEKIFGGIQKTISPEHSVIIDFHCISLGEQILREMESPFTAERGTDVMMPEIYAFLSSRVGEVYARGEEYHLYDLELENLNSKYKKVHPSLFRKRYVHLVRLGGKIAGVAAAYRGPLGMNFSFLENRCDLIIDENLEPEKREGVIFALMKETAGYYFDRGYPYEPDFIPVMTFGPAAGVLEARGGVLFQEYRHSVWLYKGFSGWYSHLEAYYLRLKKIIRKRRDRKRNG